MARAKPWTTRGFLENLDQTWRAAQDFNAMHHPGTTLPRFTRNRFTVKNSWTYLEWHGKVVHVRTLTAWIAA
eukprot:2789297-Prorocentrum_lima.AAC.1